jgi:hypothetical protein
MDEDKPRKRDTQPPGLAKRETHARASGPLASAARDPCPPRSAVGDFFAAVRP